MSEVLSTDPVTLSMADLCELYASAYHAGHHDTVESRYTHVLPVDADSYHHEAVIAWLKERSRV